MTLSLDGYIADADGRFDWAVPSPELHQFHNDRVREQDAQLLGRRLYETMLYWETAERDNEIARDFADVWLPMPKIVFSNTLTEVEGQNTRLARGDLASELAGLDGRVGIGGAGLAAEAMRRGLIDEYELFLVPVVVGGGTPYFPPDVRLDLELAETRSFGETIYLRYRSRSSKTA
ncbi:MAG TPA: dihydrofolate reductase family protein [Solirubrobacter sp.]|nr:dihydrofolate reductase family protein [Solirubrobacter sp.]